MQDWQRIINEAVGRLGRGDAEVVGLLEGAAAHPAAPPPIFLLLADARARSGDQAGEQAALDAALARDGRYVPALLARGELAARIGDDRAAVSFLTLALSQAPASGPAALAARLERAGATIAAAKARFADHLDTALAEGGATGEHPPRFAEALAILTGRAEPQLQQPTSFFYPGLPQTAFHDPADHPWTKELEEAAPAIRAELEALLAERENGFAPYVQGEANRPNRGHALLDDPRWSALYLWKDGVPVEPAATRCPATMHALEAAPLPRIPGRSPNVLFSMLRPRTHIPPHWGMLNTRLICHLPLIVPDGCRLKVGNHERRVEAGKVLLFDDSLLHEAWNDSDEVRIILLLEVWNPALSEDERARLTSMFAAINLYGEG